MAILEDTFTSALAVVLSATATLPTRIDAVRPLTDDDLLGSQRTLADARRALDAAASLVAGEISHRSRRELGYDGLAQRSGFRTAEKLVQHTTGSTARDAAGLVTIGTLVHDAEAFHSTSSTPFESTSPWLLALGTAVAAGCLSIEAAQSIRNGLGSPSPDVSIAQLTAAVDFLLVEATQLNADQLFRRARDLRDELDLAGVADRERQLHEARSVRRVRRPNGLSRYIIDPDLESAAYWDALYDTLLSPRRNSPRFVDPEDKAWADAVATDPRRDEQYLHDAFTQLLRLGVDADVADRAASRGARLAAARRAAAGAAAGAGAGAARATSTGSASTGTASTGSASTASASTASGPADNGLGTAAEPTIFPVSPIARHVLASRRPAVRVLVTSRALANREGLARIEGTDLPVSIATAERFACSEGTVPLEFDDTGQAIDVGRERRFFTSRQRIALAARHGGCAFGDCDRPPSACEAHHIRHWKRDEGRTDLAEGILLCQHHHLLVHNNGWEIARNSDGYWITPPADVDPSRTPRLMHTLSAALRDLLAAQV